MRIVPGYEERPGAGAAEHQREHAEQHREGAKHARAFTQAE